MKLIIHGGFFSESDQSHEVKVAKQQSIRKILEKSFDYLQTHTSAETAVYAVKQLEDDILFNAGTGSQIQSDGKIRMSASLMNGTTQKFSGVINIEDVKNPISIAELLMKEDDRVLGGTGANKYAAENGFERFSTEIPQRRKEYEEKLKSTGRGTVGCVVLDREGHLAAATSTGGKGFELVGRISDSATVAGNYSNSHCAVSCTGVGEDIVSNGTAAKIVTRVTDGLSVEEAIERTFSELKEIDGFAGAIVLDKSGNMGYRDSHPMMVFGSYDGSEFSIFE